MRRKWNRVLCALKGHPRATADLVYENEDVTVLWCPRCEQLFVILSVATYLRWDARRETSVLGLPESQVAMDLAERIIADFEGKA